MGIGMRVGRLLHIVPGAGPVDLYERVDVIPWGQLQSFFDANLK